MILIVILDNGLCCNDRICNISLFVPRKMHLFKYMKFSKSFENLYCFLVVHLFCIIFCNCSECVEMALLFLFFFIDVNVIDYSG